MVPCVERKMPTIIATNQILGDVIVDAMDAEQDAGDEDDEDYDQDSA